MIEPMLVVVLGRFKEMEVSMNKIFGLLVLWTYVIDLSFTIDLTFLYRKLHNILIGVSQRNTQKLRGEEAYEKI